MKKLLLLVPLALVTCAVIAQTVLPNGVSFRKQPLPYTPQTNSSQGSSRVAQEITLDYFANEFNEATAGGSQAFYLSWAVNNAFDVTCTPIDTTDFSSLKWAGVRFDSLFDVGSGTVYDIATSSIVVDTVYVTLAEHQNNSGLNDTLVVRIMEVDAASVPTVDRGLTYQTGTNSEVISNNVLWSDTLIFNVSLTPTIGTLTFPVNGGTAGGLNIPNPENGFIVMMDYFGPKIDSFFIADANNFACGGSSLPVTSFVPRNSLSYINYNFVNAGSCTDLSGVDDLVAGSGAPCNVFYRQNMGISASVRVDQITQSCGTVTGTPGFRPDTNNVPCIVQSQFYQETVEFELPSTFGPFTLNSMTIDSVTNMPCGIGYTLDRPNATYGPGEVGCVTYSGTSTDPVGQYKLNVYVTIDVQVLGVTQGELSDLAGQLGYTGFSQYLRVKATSGAACPNIGSPAQNLTSSGTVCTAVPLSVSASASPSTICAGASLTLSATASGGTGNYTYTWMPGNLSGATVSGVSPSSTTTYTVTVNDGNTTSTDVVTVTVNPPSSPSVSLSNNQATLCAGQNFVFTANATNAGTNPTYAWYLTGGTNTGITTQSYTATAPIAGETFTVYVTSSDPCASPATTSASVTIVNCGSPLSATASAASSTICAGGSTTLTAAGVGGTGSYTYTWQPGNLSGSSVVVSPTSTTTYTVTVNDGSNTASASAAVAVNPTVTPSVSINNNQATLCSGQAFVFSANPTNGGGSPSYQWTLNGNNVNSTGTYSTGTLNVGDIVAVTLTSNATCASPTTATSSVTIVNCSAPLSVTASGGTTVCAGVSTVLTATGTGGTGSYSYTWQPGNLSGSTVTVAPTSTTTYTVTVNDGSNTATANTIVNVTPSVTPSVNISNNQANLCSGQSFTFTANPINGGTTPNYNWTLNSNTVSTSSSYTSGVLNAGDVVRVTMTSNATCASPTTANASVTIANCSGPLSVTATGGNALCAGGSATLNAVGDGGSGNYTYTWMPGSLSGASVTVSPAVTTTYTVTVNDGSTTSTATTTVTVNPTPTAFAGNDVTICNGGSASLTATGGVAYTWSPGTGLSCTNCATPDATPTASTIYSVTVTDGNGCTATDEVVVSVSTTALAEVSITADDDTLCAGGSYTFTAAPVNGGTPSYQWTLNGNNVGANSATLVLANLDIDDEIACVMTSSLGCVTNTTATSNTLTVINCNVGILDITKQSININVMPNPSAGLFYVDLAEVKGDATVEVFNMQGQLVFTELTDKTTLSVDLTEYGQGLYLLRVSTEYGVATKKLIKE